MRKKILQVLAFVFAAGSVVGLAQAPKDGVYISDEDVKAVLKHAVDTIPGVWRKFSDRRGRVTAFSETISLAE